MIGAVDIGGTKIAVGIVDPDVHVVLKKQSPTDVRAGFDSAMLQVGTLLRQCAQEAGVAIHGIGIGCCGPVDSETGRLGNVNNLPGWEGGNLVDALEQQFNVPTALENDADAGALGEFLCEPASSKKRFLYVTVGTGIGVGMVFDGEIYRGASGFHPEIGHHILDPSGPLCSCGVRGCWESLAAGPAMARWWKENVSAVDGTAAPDAREICARAQRGEELAKRAVEREAYYLGLGIANLITFFAPDAIVLGGSVMRSANLFFDRMQQVVREQCTLVPVDTVEITLARLGADAGLLGAAQVWHHRFDRSERDLPGKDLPANDHPEKARAGKNLAGQHTG